MKENIKLIVQSVFGVDNFIVPHRRKKERVARQVYAYLLDRYTKMKPAEIAVEIGRDRASVYACVKTIENKLSTGRLKKEIEECTRFIVNADPRFQIGHYYWTRFTKYEVRSPWYIAKFDGMIDEKYVWRVNGSVTVSVHSSEFESDGIIKHE